MKLKRKSTIILALLLAIVSVFAVVAPTFAANGNASANQPTQAPQDGLAVVAPVAARPDQSVTMTVFKRSDQTPAEGASVWVLTKDQATQIQSDLSQLRSSGTKLTAVTDWGSIVSPYGSLLGTTDARGKLTTTFSEGGSYMLFAIESGYLPGRTNIRVVVPAKALTIQAPQQASANTTVTISVAEHASGTPVQGAGVWALTKDEAQSLQSELSSLKASGQTVNATTDWSSLLSGYGTLLGTTDANGAVTASFTENGGYLLMAVETGYLPGRARLLVGTRPQPLALEVPGRAKVGDNVTVSVTNRLTGDAVANAGVWALSRSDAQALRQEISRLKGSKDGSAGTDLSAWLGSHGSYIGATDANGSLTTSFTNPGPEVLVTWKTGTLPGLGIVVVTGPNSGNGGPSGSAGSNGNGNSGNATPPANTNALGAVR